METITKKTLSEAQNLLWRWNSNGAGKEAFENSIARRCDDPIREAANHAFNGTPATYTDRIEDLSRCSGRTNDLSPASIDMLKYSAEGYYPADLPKVTQEAMLKWLRERTRILWEFGRFFDDDKPHHPYQICIGQARGRLRDLEITLQNAFKIPQA
jgi:hypothetical protein